MHMHLRDVFLTEQNVAVEGDVLKNVVLHGPVSTNGNEYSLDAMRSLVPLLEGRDVYVNHRVGKKARDVDERFGHAQNVRVVEHDHDGRPRVRGDLHFMRSHKDCAQIIEAYTKGAPYYGTSIVADGTGRQDGRKRFVEQVTRVASLDLVDRAATGSLVEQDEGEGEAPADPAARMTNAMCEMISAIVTDTSLDKAGKMAKIEAILDAAETPAPGEAPAAPAEGDAPPPMSEQRLAKMVGNLVEQALARRDEKHAGLVEQEVQRRLADARYVKPATTPGGPPPPQSAAKDVPPQDPAARKKWLHSN
jgi:hypothetical protein